MDINKALKFAKKACKPFLLYRVCQGDNPILEKGQTISAQGSYIDKILGEDKGYLERVEKALNESYASPNEVDRMNSLYLFHDIKDAFAFSSKMYNGNARIYTVKNIQGVPARRDMNVLDVINAAIRRYNWDKNEVDKSEKENVIDSKDCLNDLCDYYWKSIHTFAPCLEYLVDKAEIIEIVCDIDKCQQFHAEFEHVDRRSVERCETYITKLNELYLTDK